MYENASPNFIELEDKTIDQIARFLILTARDIQQKEKETGKELLNIPNEQPDNTK